MMNGRYVSFGWPSVRLPLRCSRSDSSSVMSISSMYEKCGICVLLTTIFSAMRRRRPTIWISVVCEP